MTFDGALHFVEYELQIIALTWMAVLYTIKAVQLSRLPMPWEQAPERGNRTAGAARSYAGIFMPWTRESSRRHLWRWFEFGAYHVGAGVAIIITFTLPFASGIMTRPVSIACALLIAPALLVGFVKIYRRIARPELSYISSFDDHFSLVTLQSFFFSAVMVLLFDTPGWRMTYFLITALFLFYVPFSKISHYVYFFFAHALSGSRYGHRGVVVGKGVAR
jgi:hypothetical protein